MSKMGDITSHISEVEIRRLLQPEHYLGAAQAFVTRALERYRAEMG